MMCVLFFEVGSCFHDVCTVVSRIYAPRFATLTLVERVGGTYMWGLTFYLANTPPLLVPRLDVDITLYYRPIEAANLPSLLVHFQCTVAD